LQMHELGKFEVAKYTLGPSVESCIERCVAKWLGESPARAAMFKDVPEDMRAAAQRRQALQILCLPEELCLEPVADPNGTLNMEVELLDVGEYEDLEGDGRALLRVLREGKKGTPVATDLSSVTAHFRIAKLLMNVSLKDTRMGLANTSDGLVMREDKTKEPIEFVVGEEEVGDEGDFVPPCIGRCLMLPKGGVCEGMRYELILRHGVPVSDMEKSINTAYAKGMISADAMPDTTGPVVIRVEVEKVVPAVSGPQSPAWKGPASLQAERRRAEQLEDVDEGRHRHKALRRWRRILTWLDHLLEGRRWRVQEDSGGQPASGGGGVAEAVAGSMYDLEWDADEAEEGGVKNDGAGATAGTAEKLAHPVRPPTSGDVDAELLRQLDGEELREWATAHVAVGRLLMSEAAAACTEGDRDTAERHIRSAVQACEIGKIPKEIEVAARMALARHLTETERAAEALEVLKPAQALDPCSTVLKDQVARTLQLDTDQKSGDVKGALRRLKQDLIAGLEADDASSLLTLLQEVDSLPLTWEAASETAIGKEVGKCARHADSGVADLAKGIVGKLHKLAKQERPLWVR